MSDFPKSSAALNAAVAAATSPEAIRELVKAALVNSGNIEVSRGFESDVTVARMPELAAPVALSMPAGQRGAPTHLRVIYPGGMARIEIVGYSEADLDSQEEKIRQRYSGRTK